MGANPSKPPTLVSRLLPFVKVLALVVAAFMVYRNVSWADTVVLKDGSAVSCRIQEGVEPEAERLVIVPEATGTPETIAAGDFLPAAKRIGVRTTIAHLDYGWWAVGMLMILVAYCFGFVRWKLLLDSQGIHISYWNSLRLTFIGFFYNNVVPGLTGGDLAKAVMIAYSNPGRRSAAVSTVIVDRIIGLAMLALVSSVVILVNFDRFGAHGFPIFGVLGGCAVLFVCCYSKRLRRLVHLSHLVKRLPGAGIIAKIDDALQRYRSHPREIIVSLGLSIVSHLFNIGCVVAFGWALGVPRETVSVALYFATVPLVMIGASVPLTPSGWGVREWLFTTMFHLAGLSRAYDDKLTLVSVLFGLSTLLWSLVGGAFLFIGRREGTIPADIVGSDAAAGDLPAESVGRSDRA